MKTLLIALISLLAFTGYSQDVITKKKVVVKDVLRFEGGDPDSLKIAVSVDGNGNFKWVYFTDFQDSINTGVYDSIIINYLYSNTVRVNRDSFTDPAASIASIGDSGFVVECFTCDTIQLLLDSTYNSPFTYNTGGNIVQRDTTLSVGIGTTSPTKPLHVKGGVLVDNDTLTVIGSDPTAIMQFYVDGFTGTFGDPTQVLDINLVGALITSEVKFVTGGSAGNYDTEINTFGGANFKINDGNQADGYVLTSDASGNATWQDHTAYGEMGFGDSTVTQALTQNVWSVVTNANNTLWQTAAIDTHNVQYSGDSLIIGKTGVYQLNAQLSVDGTANSVIRLGVYVNGSLACTCTGYQELINNRIIQVTYINIDGLTAGDVVQVVITNTANNDDVDAIGGKITINKIR